MYRCPKCGNYLSCYIENIYNGYELIWECLSGCGYSSKEDKAQIKQSNKTDKRENAIIGEYSYRKSMEVANEQ